VSPEFGYVIDGGMCVFFLGSAALTSNGDGFTGVPDDFSLKRLRRQYVFDYPRTLIDLRLRCREVSSGLQLPR
jgi:hypothetical protein